MNDKILVGYATKHGSTGEIASEIAQVLRNRGMQVDDLTFSKVKDLTPYSAFILGSAVYIGRWRKEAAKFLKKNEPILTGKPVWLFSSGPTGNGEPAGLMDGWQFPSKLHP